MAKKKWKWKHRVAVSPKNGIELSHLIGWCNEFIGSYENNWDFTKLKKRSKSTGIVSYSCIKFFFREEQHSVLFKLTHLYQ